MTEEIKLDPVELFGEGNFDPSDEPDYDPAGHQDDSDATPDDAADGAKEDADSEATDEAADVKTDGQETEEATEDADAGDNTTEDGTGEKDAEGDVFEVGGEEYTLPELNKHVMELEAGSLRQADYTKKTQVLAERRKAVDADVSLTDAIKSAGLLDSVLDALKESGVDDADKLVEAVKNGIEIPHPDTEKAQELQAKLEEIQLEAEATRELESALNDLVITKGISKQDGEAVRAFAEDYFNEKGVALPLDTAYDLWQVKAGKTIVKRKQPTIPKTPTPKSGVKPKEDSQWDEWDGSRLFG